MLATSDARPLAAGYRHVVDRVPMWLRRSLRYRSKHGHFPSLLRPRTFTEKVTWRILRDRRELLRITCDKKAMKAHAEHTAPAGVRVPATLWSGVDLDDLARVALPEHWVLKPNHRTGLVLFGSGQADVVDLRDRTEGWLERPEWERDGEWAYSAAEPCLLVEERIGAPDASLTDYKFFVFDGRARMVQTHTERFGAHGSRMYSPDWAYLGGATNLPPGEEVPRPALLGPMIEAAEAIGAGYDFIRVDLYEHDGVLWFGELTPYPGSGLVHWQDDELDRLAGSWWRLPNRPR